MVVSNYLRHLAGVAKYGSIVISVFFIALLNNTIILADDHSNAIETAECCEPISNSYTSTEDTLSEEEILEIQSQNYFDRNIPGELESFEELHKDEIHFLACIITAEAGFVDQEPYSTKAIEAGITPDIWQQYVGYVVMNRVYQDSFPNTLEGVFYDKGSYHKLSHISVQNGIVTDRCISNATIVLKNYYDNSVPVPRNMVYQAEFPQGSDVYLHVGNTYFCIAGNLPSE